MITVKYPGIVTAEELSRFGNLFRILTGCIRLGLLIVSNADVAVQIDDDGRHYPARRPPRK
jgi:hypothetical protein